MSLEKTGEFRAPLLGYEKCALCGLESKGAQDSQNFVPFTPQLWVEEGKGRFVKNEQHYICSFCYSQILRDYFMRGVAELDRVVGQRPEQAS